MRISVENITRRFGSFVALDSVTATFESGGICVLAGPNGAGKTTLLKIIAGLIDPSGGRVSSEGGVRLGVMMQESYLYRGLTPRENLDLYARLLGTAPGRIDEIAALLELDRFIDHEVATLSHGQKQRVSLARALLGEPNALILDEPFLGLDTASVAHAIRYLESIKAAGGIALVATHDLDAVKGCADRLLFLEAGHVKYFDRFNI